MAGNITHNLGRMKWITAQVRRLVGLEDTSEEDPFVGKRSTAAVKIKVGMGAAVIVGLAIVILAVLASAVASVNQPELPHDLEVTASGEPLPQTGSTFVVMVHIVGEVNSPGMYELAGDSRVIDAVMAAGGLTSNAAECAVNLARVVNDGEQLTIPSLEQGCTTGSAQSHNTQSVSLNSATSEQFDSLPGIGPTLAQRIVDYRESNGGFSSIDQLNDVSGIGDKLFAGVKEHITL